MQNIIDMMSDAAKTEREKYHVKLGDLISFLAEHHEKIVRVPFLGTSVKSPDSYRGYYSDLALSPSKEPITAKELHGLLSLILNTNLTGYKGGEYMMDRNTPLWISNYGQADGLAVVSVDVDYENNFINLITKKVD